VLHREHTLDIELYFGMSQAANFLHIKSVFEN
jgi:hypothetical protein